MNLIWGRGTDPKLLALWEKHSRRTPGGANSPAGSNQHRRAEVNVDIIDVDLPAERPTGTSASAGMRRLQREAEAGNEKAASLVTVVINGTPEDPKQRLSINAACVATRWRKPTDGERSRRAGCLLDALGERDENEVRKDFTMSERLDIGRAVEALVGERRGRPKAHAANPGLFVENPQNIAELPRGRETRDVAAERAGFGNRETYAQAKKVVDDGVPELVQAVDAGAVSISAAAQVAKLPKDEQADGVFAGEIKPSADVRVIEFRGAAIETVLIDGRPHAAVKPMVEDMGLEWSSQLQRLKRRAWDRFALFAAPGRLSLGHDSVSHPQPSFPQAEPSRAAWGLPRRGPS